MTKPPLYSLEKRISLILLNISILILIRGKHCSEIVLVHRAFNRSINYSRLMICMLIQSKLNFSCWTLPNQKIIKIILLKVPYQVLIPLEEQLVTLIKAQLLEIQVEILVEEQVVARMQVEIPVVVVVVAVIQQGVIKQPELIPEEQLGRILVILEERLEVI